MLNFEQHRSIPVRAVAALVARPIRERSAHAGIYRTQTSHRCLKLLLSKAALSFNGSPSICITVEIKLKGQQFYGRLLFCKCEWVGLCVCVCVSQLACSSSLHLISLGVLVYLSSLSSCASLYPVIHHVTRRPFIFLSSLRPSVLAASVHFSVHPSSACLELASFASEYEVIPVLCFTPVLSDRVVLSCLHLFH